MSPEEIQKLQEHSQMLGQIASLIEDYCTPEMTTLDGVKALIADKESETRWANHYCRKLVDAQRGGHLPENFSF